MAGFKLVNVNKWAPGIIPGVSYNVKSSIEMVQLMPQIANYSVERNAINDLVTQKFVYMNTLGPGRYFADNLFKHIRPWLKLTCMNFFLKLQ